MTRFEAGTRLRLLTYNIQIGIETGAYHHYPVQLWRHFLPDRKRHGNLKRIASVISGFDVVGLQEADSGSLRSAFVNLTEYLATHAGFPWWFDRTNRTVGRFARHSIGLLSRVPVAGVEDHRLPGAIPGRGAIALRLGDGPDPLVLVLFHLALGPRSRARQFDYLAELVQGHRHAILMGDTNCVPTSPEMRRWLHRTGLAEPDRGLLTYPSWRPAKKLDHILVTPGIEIVDVRVLPCDYSDHLPIAAEVIVPSGAGVRAAEEQEAALAGAV